MPLDHYISQVHLKKFYSPSLANRMYAIRKSDMKTFTPDAQSVCRTMDGNTNAYLLYQREIEDFLKTIEPNYNATLDKMSAGKVDNECICTIAGFIAYVIVCSPAGMRLHSEPLKSTVETAAALIEAQGLLPPPPVQLGHTTLTDLLKKGVVEVTIDHKYPQAIGIRAIRNLAFTFGNLPWEVLHNDSNSPFFTSDYPVAIEEVNALPRLNRIVPLSPTLAVRIKSAFGDDKFSCRHRKIRHDEVVKINTLIVRCAEENLFYRDDLTWILPFVAKNRNFRIEVTTQKQRALKGTIQVSKLGIVDNASSWNHR